MPKLLLALLIFSLAFAIERAPPGDFNLVKAALADDDDDDDGGGRGGFSARNDDDDDNDVLRRSVRRRQASRPGAPPPPPPIRAPDEIVVQGLNDGDLDQLLGAGFSIIREINLQDGQSLRRLRKPAALTLGEARDAVRQYESGGNADFNHFYRGESGTACLSPDCPARQMIAWPVSSGCGGTPPRIGMVDTGLNAGHEALANSEIVVHRLESGDRPSGAMHGTAVAALLVGSPSSRAPGLVPHMSLVVVDAFHKVGADERADVFALIEALDLLERQRVRIINLSLSGPPNMLLERRVSELDVREVLVVAAAGNGGPNADPAYPAGYETVLAVTAVDRRGRIYRRAGRGPHIDLAAPGVAVWTAASIRGTRTKTGTSFAAPFVTATAALMLEADPDLVPANLRRRLLDSANDLGEAGRDDIFGHGLLKIPPLCENRRG